MLDVTDIEDVKTGDEVVVFGTGENGEPTADSLAENGRLVYSTCTVNDKENQAQVEKSSPPILIFTLYCQRRHCRGRTSRRWARCFCPTEPGRTVFLPPSWNETDCKLVLIKGGDPAWAKKSAFPT